MDGGGCGVVDTLLGKGEFVGNINRGGGESKKSERCQIRRMKMIDLKHIMRQVKFKVK